MGKCHTHAYTQYKHAYVHFMCYTYTSMQLDANIYKSSRRMTLVNDSFQICGCQRKCVHAFEICSHSRMHVAHAFAGVIRITTVKSNDILWWTMHSGMPMYSLFYDRICTSVLKVFSWKQLKKSKVLRKNQAFVRVISSSNISSIWYFRVKIKVSFDFFQFHCWFSIFYFSFSIFHSPFSIFYFLFKDLRENSINCKTIWKSASIHRCTMCWNRIWWHSLKQCYRLRNSMKQPYWKRQRF